MPEVPLHTELDRVHCQEMSLAVFHCREIWVPDTVTELLRGVMIV